MFQSVLIPFLDFLFLYLFFVISFGIFLCISVIVMYAFVTFRIILFLSEVLFLRLSSIPSAHFLRSSYAWLLLICYLCLEFIFCLLNGKIFYQEFSINILNLNLRIMLFSLSRKRKKNVTYIYLRNFKNPFTVKHFSYLNFDVKI